MSVDLHPHNQICIFSLCCVASVQLSQIDITDQWCDIHTIFLSLFGRKVGYACVDFQSVAHQKRNLIYALVRNFSSARNAVSCSDFQCTRRLSPLCIYLLHMEQSLCCVILRRRLHPAHPPTRSLSAADARAGPFSSLPDPRETHTTCCSCDLCSCLWYSKRTKG